MEAYTNFNGDYGSHVQGTGVSVTSTGSIKFKFTWNPTYGPAPTRNYVQLQNTAGAQGEGNGASASVSNGPESLSASGSPVGVEASKVEYKSFSNDAEISASLSAFFSGGSEGGYGTTKIIPRYTILPKYTLYNPDMEDGGNYAKGANGRVLNQPTPDGDKTLDAVVKWSITSDPLLPPTGGPTYALTASTSQPLNGTYGFWADQDRTWNLTGNGTPSAQMQGDMGIGSPSIPIMIVGMGDRDANALNAESSFSALVTDGSDFGAPIVRSRYVVRWHLPYENWEKEGSQWDHVIRPKVQLVRGDGDYPGNSESAEVKLNYVSAWWDVGTVGSDLAAGFLPWPFGGLANAASITVERLTPEEEKAFVNFVDLWGHPESTPSIPPRPSNPQARLPDNTLAGDAWEITDIYRKLTYNAQRWVGDAYAMTGYQGRTSNVTYNLRSKGWFAHFSEISGTATSPGGSGGGGTTPPTGPGNPGGTTTGSGGAGL